MTCVTEKSKIKPDRLSNLKSSNQKYNSKSRFEFEPEIRNHNKAAQEAENIWIKSSEHYNCNEHQDYLLKKGVQNFGLRYGEYYEKPALVIPFRDINGKIRTLQFIYKDEDGNFEKRFLKGGEKSGNFASIGEIEENKPFCVCEGYATGASVYEATGIPVVVAGDSGNIKKVIENLRTIYPQNEITIAADKDKNDVGQKKAKEAAELYNCNVILPNFEDKAIDEKNTDFNDLHKSCGLAEVKRQLINEPEYSLKKEDCKISKKESSNLQIPLEHILEYRNRNERGDAELFLKIHERKYIFDSSEGKNGEFYVWTGTSWQLDRTKQRYKDLDCVASVYEKAAGEALKNKEKEIIVEELKKRAFQLRTNKRVESVLKFVSYEVTIQKEWDHFPEKLPLSNGIFDLKTGVLSNHSQDNYIRSICPTKYNSDATCPNFDIFLNDIFLGDQDLIAFMLRVLGSAILGTAKEEKIFILYGKDGRNGKGTLMQTLERILGPIAKTFPSEMLLLQRNPPSSSTARPEKANLQGCRVAIFSEIDENRKIDASEVKNLSGRDTITCRRLFSNVDIQIKPSHTIFIQTNFKPKSSAKDNALWKRIVSIPFNVEFVDEPEKDKPNQRKIDEGFKEKLILEAEGILNKLIQGCLDYQKNGLSIPEIVKNETATYRKENDGIALFIEQRCTLDPVFSTPCRQMQKAIKEYCKEEGLNAPNEREISSYLRDKFGEPSRTNKGSFYKGVSITCEFDNE